MLEPMWSPGSLRGVVGWVLWGVIVSVPNTNAPAAESPLEATRAGVAQWVQTRQLISSTRSDWERDKEALTQTKALYERELASIEERFSRLSTNVTQVDRDLTQARVETEAAEAALARAKELAGALESRLNALLPQLPPPLRQQADPLLKRLPKNADSAEKASAAERLQTVVGLLNEIDKFNGSVAVVSEVQKTADGAEVQVDTVYLGLAQAWFVDREATIAGVGVPGARGWEWESRPELAPAIRLAIAAYREAETPQFVLLPFTLR